MLILTRKIGQELLVGDEIVIRVMGMNKYGIEIGVDAPKALVIQRAEKAYLRERKCYGDVEKQ